MRRIRVLHITPSVRLLGARRSLLTLVTQLGGTRIEPIVLAPTEGALTEELDKRKLPWIKLRQLRLGPWRKFGSWLSLPSQIAALRELCDDERIDLVHCNEIYPNPHAVIACSDAPIPSEMLRRILLGSSPAPLVRPIVTHMRLSVTPRMVRNYFLESATRIIAVSEGAAHDFDPFPWKQDKVRVVHNGIDMDEFASALERRHLTRQQLNLADDDFVIGQIGLLMPRKRPRFLVEAAPAILKAVPNAKFLFVGETSPRHEHYLEELKTLAVELKLGDAIRFVPFQRRIAEIFGALDVNVLISNDEGFGRVIIEAGAAHVPTIGSNVGGIPELITHAQTGIVLGPPDADDEEFWKEMPQFVEAVTTLARDPSMRRRLGDSAYESARSRFSAERYVEGVVRVFEEALDEFS